MNGDNLETDAILNVRYLEHLKGNDRLDAIEEAIEDLIEDAGEVRGSREVVIRFRAERVSKRVSIHEKQSD